VRRPSWPLLCGLDDPVERPRAGFAKRDEAPRGLGERAQVLIGGSEEPHVAVHRHHRTRMLPEPFREARPREFGSALVASPVRMPIRSQTFDMMSAPSPPSACARRSPGSASHDASSQALLVQ